MSDIQWQQPLALHQDITATAYPIGALPTSIHDAVLSYHAYGQQPLALLACSALSNISLACQGLANVARDKMLVSPVSLYFLIISPSGSRKSAADNAFGQAIKAWEEKTREKIAPDYHQARTERAAWLIKARALASRIRASIAKEEDSDNEAYQYTQHLLAEPTVPLLPQLTFEDITPEALTQSLAEGWPSGSLWSDEGGIVLSSPGMKHDSAKLVALLNRLWDGKSIGIHRKSSENICLKDRRLTLSLMMQPLLLTQMLKKSSGIVRHSGFLARVLMAYPTSTMGQRFYQEPQDTTALLSTYNQSIQACLSETKINGKAGFNHIPTLSFSQPAKKAWVAIFNHIEKALHANGVWEPINDLASKAGENIARLSALFHLYEGNTGVITVENVERAHEIITWHLHEAKRILYTDVKQSNAERDAQQIIKWIRQKNLKQITPREILQSSPVRNKKSRDEALQLLADKHHITVTQQSGVAVVVLNPALA